MPSERKSRRHDSLYLPTGDITLLAVDPKENEDVLFRVHSTLLAHYSPVFSDMFSAPMVASDLNVNETYDGVPLIRIPDDFSPFEVLLKVICDPT